MNTKEFAKHYKVKPQSVLSAKSRSGTFNGIKPTMIKNRLYWQIPDYTNVEDSIQQYLLNKDNKIIQERIRFHASFVSHLCDITNTQIKVEAIRLASKGLRTPILCEYCKKEKAQNKFCSRQCAIKGTAKARRKTNKERYGGNSPFHSKQVQDKAIETVKKVWGVDHISKSKEIKDKIKRTQRNNGGWCSTRLEVKNKIQETNLKRYGTKHPMQSTQVKEKIAKTNSKKYGTPTFAQKNIKNKTEYLNNVSFKKFARGKTVFDLVKRYNVTNATINKRIKSTGAIIKRYSSSKEKQMHLSLKGFVFNDRTVLGGLELDAYSKEHNLAVEFNGNYWHGESKKDKHYHISKTEKCLSLGIDLIHVYEYLWDNPTKQEIYQSMFNNRLGKNTKIFARKCDIKQVFDTKDFLNHNHLQGYCASSVAYGLFFGGVLVSLMTFGNPRFNKKYDWEFLRFCSVKGITIVGGASKLLKAFKGGPLITYAQRDYSNGRIYDKLGFSILRYNPPSYVWFRHDGVFSRYQTQKKKLFSRYPEVDRTKSETQIMHSMGYQRIYNAGTITYIKG